MTRELQGKVVLLTGATEGIGKVAAFELARLGASLTLVGRNREKSERVLAEIKSATGNQGVALLLADLSSLAEVRALAAKFAASHDRLDVLANNAGAVFSTCQHTVDGFERTFALNHLSPFLLTRELWPLLVKTPGARVVTTSSAAHLRGRIDFDDIARRPSRKAGFGVYSASKLANILFTRELARRLSPSGAIANCVHPGFVRSGFGLNNPDLLGLAVKVAAAVAGRTPEKGAETLVWLAASPAAGKVTGEYWKDRQVGRTSSAARDDATAKRLWDFSEQLCASALGEGRKGNGA